MIKLSIFKEEPRLKSPSSIPMLNKRLITLIHTDANWINHLFIEMHRRKGALKCLQHKCFLLHCKTIKLWCIQHRYVPTAINQISFTVQLNKIFLSPFAKRSNFAFDFSFRLPSQHLLLVRLLARRWNSKLHF